MSWSDLLVKCVVSGIIAKRDVEKDVYKYNLGAYIEAINSPDAYVTPRSWKRDLFKDDENRSNYSLRPKEKDRIYL